jgi:hypothetical protein
MHRMAACRPEVLNLPPFHLRSLSLRPNRRHLIRRPHLLPRRCRSPHHRARPSRRLLPRRCRTPHHRARTSGRLLPCRRRTYPHHRARPTAAVGVEALSVEEARLITIDCLLTRWCARAGPANYRDDRPPKSSVVRSLNLKSETEWRSYCKSGNKPDNIPTNPSYVYANDGWAGLGDWLGTGRRRGSNFRSFTRARAFAHKLKLQSRAEWDACRRSDKLPPRSSAQSR